ncbi:MAG: nascent polypeptide-associated complex protein [Sulfolobaceae archaeon]
MKIKQSDLKKLEKMGLKTEQIDAIKVIIETKDKIITIENPMVIKASVMGQDAITITGGVIKEEEKKQQQKFEIKDEDVKFVMEQTGKSEKEVREALVKAEGDIAKAILILTGQQ